MLTQWQQWQKLASLRRDRAKNNNETKKRTADWPTYSTIITKITRIIGIGLGYGHRIVLINTFLTPLFMGLESEIWNGSTAPQSLSVMHFCIICAESLTHLTEFSVDCGNSFETGKVKVQQKQFPKEFPCWLPHL